MVTRRRWGSMSRFKLLMFLGWILGPELARMETKKHCCGSSFGFFWAPCQAETDGRCRIFPYVEYIYIYIMYCRIVPFVPVNPPVLYCILGINFSSHCNKHHLQ